MYARLQNGPLAGQQFRVPDPPQEVLHREGLDPDDDMLVPIQPGAPFPEAKFITYEYQFVGFEPVPSPMAPSGTHRVALYVYVGRVSQAA